jgi:dTDP-4-dehydrorhamnose reductase
MTEKPFVHKKAFYNVKTNFIFQEQVAKIIFKILNYKGVINVGGNIQTVYNFAKKFNNDIKKTYLKKNNKYNFPLNPSMNINKIKKILNSNFF